MAAGPSLPVSLNKTSMKAAKSGKLREYLHTELVHILVPQLAKFQRVAQLLPPIAIVRKI